LFIINENEIEKGDKISKWLIGPWNTHQEGVEFGVAELKKGDFVKAHFHMEVHEILYLIEGVLEIALNDEKKEIGKGTAVYFEPNIVHSFLVLSEYAKIVAVKSPSLAEDKFYI